MVQSAVKTIMLKNDFIKREIYRFKENIKMNIKQTVEKQNPANCAHPSGASRGALGMCEAEGTFDARYHQNKIQ